MGLKGEQVPNLLHLIDCIEVILSCLFGRRYDSVPCII